MRHDDVNRSRWAAIDATIAVTLGCGAPMTASAAVGTGERSVYVPIAPCRVMDTRGGSDNVPRRLRGVPADRHGRFRRDHPLRHGEPDLRFTQCASFTCLA